MPGFFQGVLSAPNADFSQNNVFLASESNGLVTNGKMWIGSTATNVGGTHINVGTLTSPNGTITIGYSSPNITLDLTGLNSSLPAFSAYLSTSPTNVTGDGTIYTIICDTVLFDQTSNYNNSTGTFTAPVTGKYLFAFGISCTPLSSNQTIGHGFISTSGITYDCFELNYFAAQVVANDFITGEFSVLTKMTAGDTANLQLRVEGGSKNVSARGGAGVPLCFMTGYLVC